MPSFPSVTSLQLLKCSNAQCQSDFRGSTVQPFHRSRPRLYPCSPYPSAPPLPNSASRSPHSLGRVSRLRPIRSQLLSSVRPVRPSAFRRPGSRLCPGTCHGSDLKKSPSTLLCHAVPGPEDGGRSGGGEGSSGSVRPGGASTPELLNIPPSPLAHRPSTHLPSPAEAADIGSTVEFGKLLVNFW